MDKLTNVKIDSMIDLGTLLENIASTQEALKESEALNRAILGSLPVHLAVLDKDGEIIAANEAWYRFGQENGDPPLSTIGIGVNYLEIGRKAAAQGDQTSLEMTVGIEAVMAQQLPSFLYEYPAHSPTEKRWFLMHVTPLRSPRGGVVIAHENITLLKQVEDALRRSEASMHIAFNSSSVAFTLVDPDYAVRAINTLAAKRSAAVVGKKVHVGDSILNYVRPEDIDSFKKRFVAALNGEYSTVEMQIPLNTGETIFYEFRYNPVMDEYGNILGVCLTNENITERKLGENALRDSLHRERELGELKTRFVSMASHEFRTPLTGILSSTELVMRYRDRMSPEKIEEHLSKIVRQVRHMNHLIDDILTLGKAQAGKLDYKPEMIDVDAMCRQIVEEMRDSDSADSQVNLVYQGIGACYEVMLDPKLLSLILNNLLTNAIKYSLSGSDVYVEVESTTQEVIITVRDSGIGIPKDDLDHIFEEFHRASNVGTISGTGLGLAITKQAVDLHKGTIDVTSEVGKGTAFRVRLPL